MAATTAHPALDSRLNARTVEFVSSRQSILIGGEFTPALDGKTLPVFNPATGQIIVEVPAAQSKDIDLAVKAARSAFDHGPWRTMSPSQRGRILNRIADLIETNGEELAQLESLNNGKPLSVARVADIPLAADLFRYMAGWTTKLSGSTIPLSFPGDFLAYTLREPIGVVGQIIPWNFPLLMAAWKLGPALATGCTVILKLAEQTPLTGLFLAQLLHEAGLPAGVVNVITGYGEEAGAPLAAHPHVDKIAFTGSTEVGKLIVNAATGNLKRVSLELGGKSPAIVFPDADLDKAIAGTASAIFFNHGQCCCAGSRLYVHQSIFDRVVEGVSEIADKIHVGAGLDPRTEMGPLVSEEQFQRVTGYIRSGINEGAVVSTRAADKPGEGYFVRPTVLTKTTPEMKVVREEIFGPVVCAQSFTDADLDKIAEEANGSIYGLAASVWTSNLSIAHKMARNIRSGTVWVNCHNVFDAALPFGGYKQSGWGREMGAEVLNSYTETKAVTISL